MKHTVLAVALSSFLLSANGSAQKNPFRFGFEGGPGLVKLRGNDTIDQYHQELSRPMH